MSQTRRKFNAEFKQQALALLFEEGLSVAEAARQLGIRDHQLRSWKKAFEKHGENAFPGHGKRTPQEEELYRLRRENQQLRQERDILKKAMGYFSNPQN